MIVLDDLHNLHNPEALGPLPELAASLNAGSTLAITSRDEPEMPLGRLRTQRRLGEVGARDLVMTPAEAARPAGGGGAANWTTQRSNGWSSAPRAGPPASTSRRWRWAPRTTSSARSRTSTATTASSPTTSATPSSTGSPASELDFLTRTSLLDRLFGPLCDAILEQDGSAEMLRRLARSNMLLVPLDRRDREYRYHALLQEMLKAELQRRGGQLEAAAARRASRWYAEHDDIDHAVKHAIAAGDRRSSGQS